MKISQFDPSDLSRSVVSVPPLAWTAENEIADEPNRVIVDRLHRGGVSTFLYGGNANLQNLPVSQFGVLLDRMDQWAPPDAWMIPSIGPDFGKALDQARVAAGRGYPALMAFPAGNAFTPGGIASGMRRLADAAQAPLIGYLRGANYMQAADIRSLASDGVLCAIKYAVESHAPDNDGYLEAICDAIGPDRIVSGMGERPAVTHLRRYGLAGFTSGAICLAPSKSMSILQAAQRGAYDEAEALRRLFVPLEDLRERLGAVPVLHAALELSDIAVMGPLQPFQEPLTQAAYEEVARLSRTLLEAEVS